MRRLNFVQKTKIHQQKAEIDALKLKLQNIRNISTSGLASILEASDPKEIARKILQDIDGIVSSPV